MYHLGTQLFKGITITLVLQNIKYFISKITNFDIAFVRSNIDVICKIKSKNKMIKQINNLINELNVKLNENVKEYIPLKGGKNYE